MTIKVIGAGFGRTGTTSLQAALVEIGHGKCYHMREVFFNPGHVPFWEAAVESWSQGEAVGSWDAVFDGYQATVDWPACSFTQELIGIYPEAKVILSVRNPERWYASTRDTIYQVPGSLFTRLIRIFLPHMRGAFRMIDKLIWEGTFENNFANADFAISCFEEHNRAIQAIVPPERLLVYDIQEGWEPLCDFLDVPVPETSFPHLNDRSIIRRSLRYGPLAIIGALLAGALTLLFILSLLAKRGRRAISR